MALTKPRASQIYNLDYKQATRVVTVSNIALSGGAPAVVDGVTLAVNDRILVAGQSTASQNGLYDVVTVGTGSNGTWVRTSDANNTGEVEAGMIVMVTEGAVYADTQWKLITDNPITIGSTALVFTQNYSANSISGGTSNVTVYSNANVTISSAGTPNVLIVSSTGTVTSGTSSITGNITGGNISTVGQVSATGNITGGNIIGNGRSLTSLYTTAATTTVATANSIYTLTGTSTPVQILTGTSVSNTIVRLPDTTTCTLGQNFTILNKISGANTTLQFSNTGNITTALGGNIFVKATVVDTGITNGWSFAYTGNTFTGTGGQLVYSQSPSFGTIYPSSIDTGGGGTLTVCQSSATLSFGGSALTQTINFWPTATSNTTYTRTLNIATSGGIANTIINIGNVANATVNIRGATSFANAVTANSTISAVGNITGNYFIGNGSALTGIVASAGAQILNGTSNVTVAGSSNVTVAVAGTTIATYATTGEYITGIISATGDITSSGNINGVNLNSTHADLAELYLADLEYSPGTVVEFGGTAEITITTKSHSSAVAGVVSTEPGHLMNSALIGTNTVAVALTGRVPCQVVGTIRKGDRLVSSSIPGVATALDMTQYQPGCIIGKALENYDSIDNGIIEVAVGRF